MKKISVKKFCEEYSNKITESLKNQYIKDNLKINTYVPFLRKNAIIDSLLKTTMIDKETGNIKVNSSAEYLLMTRIFIEQYTNLAVETAGFFEEYDELKKSGIINKLLIGNEKDLPLIPIEEIAEFKHILNIKKNDLMQNKYEIHSFISEQMDRFKTLGKVTLTPLMDAVSKKLNEIPKDDLDKIVEFAKKGKFKEM